MKILKNYLALGVSFVLLLLSLNYFMFDYNKNGNSKPSFIGSILQKKYLDYSDAIDEHTKKILEPEPYNIRKEKLVERTKPKTARTMKQIFEIPSKYSLVRKDDEDFSLTAVVSLYRRANMTKRWIDALVNQTHPPKIIWIVNFASPISKI
ncbi:unnamed protein product [Brachionus calyciflorus]|uniref:Uncharacterized protein n=1 Tax=Brachionus calyciflorus TaxID=104777 RepID=A0A813P000_9BILA|nr:unnamed protein product [Brachionus calyciflorus]